MPCTVACDKISIDGVIRSASIEILDDYGDDLERILDYMELTRELERDKLFVLVNLRSFYRDEEIAPFFRSILDHSLSVLLVDSVSKALLPLPEKFHGLTNTELRYRQRYVDLFMNPEVKDVFLKRSRILSEIRAYLDGKSYQEIADKLGRHVKSIDNALQRVKRKMEKFLEEAKSQDD